MVPWATVDATLLELLRHKTWAMVRLLEHCASLQDEQLDATTPGTYGTIRETLHHIVRSDEDYLWMLTHEHIVEPLGPDERIALDQLAERVRRVAPAWEQVADDAGRPGREAVADDGVRMPGTVPLAQAIHHADDHRMHVLSILGARGLAVPRLDVWAYARSESQLREPSDHLQEAGAATP